VELAFSLQLHVAVLLVAPVAVVSASAGSPLLLHVSPARPLPSAHTKMMTVFALL
jgi:hypothetical protein